MNRKWLSISFAFSMPFVMSANAFVLDWTSYGYTNGDTDFTFTDVDGSGIDVRVIVTGDLEFNGTWPRTVALGSTDFYQVFMNWNSNADNIRIRMLFYETGTSTRAEVRNLTFSIYDIDRRSTSSTTGVEDDTPPPPYTYQDEIRRIRGRTISSGFNTAGIYPDLDAGATGTGSISISGEGTVNSSVLGLGYYNTLNPKARLDVTFNDDVAGADFLYENGPNAPANPGGQTVLIGDFSFSALPEPGAWVACFLFSILFFCSESRRRRHQVH